MHCATGKTCDMRADCRLAELVQPSLATLVSACWIVLQMRFVDAGVRCRPLISAAHRQLAKTAQLAGDLRLQDVFSMCSVCSDIPCECW